MTFPIFSIFIVFLVLLNIHVRKSNKSDEAVKRAFFERERAADSARKKPLKNLNYIHIPDDIPPRITFALSGDAREAAERIRQMKYDEVKIVNLTGYTNTDLKLEYGAANISDLVIYDTNFSSLVTALQDCGKALYEAGKYEDAKSVLEFAIQCGTDIRESYRLLIDMYRTKLFLDKDTASQKISSLLTVAETLKSLSKDSIIKSINEAL